MAEAPGAGATAHKKQVRYVIVGRCCCGERHFERVRRMFGPPWD